MNDLIPSEVNPRDLNDWLKESSSTSPILVDVREKEELAIAPFPYSVIHLPLSEHSLWFSTYSINLTFESPVVVICHSGIRSLNFGIWLLEQDPRYKVWNLTGGIDAWSQCIDSSVPRY